MRANLGSYFHGTLEVTIYRAVTPATCLCFAADHPASVSIEIDGEKVAETSREYDKEWNQKFLEPCAHPAGAAVVLALRTREFVLGRVLIPAVVLLQCVEGEGGFSGEAVSGAADQASRRGKAKIEFSIRFWPAGNSPEVVISSFPVRENCRVVLYQDAHHGDGFRPPVIAGEGRERRPRNLWEDVFRAIDGAEFFVCIAGWSLNPKLVLVRDPLTCVPEALGLTLGELLKRKADEGVVVRLLLWDDETSLPFIRNPGMMRTHDEDVVSFFHNTNVNCRLCPRLDHHWVPSFFTHHQKTITVDAGGLLLRSFGLPAADADDQRREIISFIGGIDLCDGRYDTESHSLFRELNAEFSAGDFYQRSISGASLSRGGPRQPWHDAHACVVGEAAGDVLTNFRQRWAQHCGGSDLPPLPPASVNVRNGDWSVQVFRSIDRISAAPEHSIHDGYVSAIRRAERFVYIENQYFIGGCQFWDDDQRIGCRNLIPVEIALKAASKIRAGERFAAYIVIPMWPEGSPDGEAVQDMLHWTRLTMSMMYRLIGEAIRESGTSSNPRDYLNFFCLANREQRKNGEYIPPSSPPAGSHYSKAQKNRRFMIYVHSKLMIVDDDYILIGSANLNQRSMDGERDTEIAIGCRQRTAHNGEIFTYRMSLWYEHTGGVVEAFAEPESLECVETMRAIGDEMWKRYSGEEVVDMEGVHLVSYPVAVSEDGMTRDLEEGGGVFPDSGVRIGGRRSKILPPACTC